ncbi:MAG: hypothetical protein FJZ38_23945 [Candidatus Rokubacteria bacterium]|nr:hypothetical protein [Candidatus Rokubacteria bacterium]
MLALGATNLVGAVLFAAVYATAGARLMSQGAFLACLLVIFLLVTTLWVRVEARHRGLGAVRRVGRVAAGLVLVVFIVPMLILMPAFWLDSYLPPEVGFTRYLGPLMTIVLIAMALTVTVNLVGLVVAVARFALTRGARVQ